MTARPAILDLMVVHLKWDPNLISEDERRRLPSKLAELLEALAELPAGEYRVEEVVTLDDEEDAAVTKGLRQLQEGKGVPHSEVKRRLGL